MAYKKLNVYKSTALYKHSEQMIENRTEKKMLIEQLRYKEKQLL